MRHAIGLLALASFAGTSAYATDAANNEVGYESGALGYEALSEGNNREALRLLAASEVSDRDPAKLINLGIAKVRVGETAEAIQLFDRAAREQSVDLVMADGSVRSSRDVARVALDRLGRSYATR